MKCPLHPLWTAAGLLCLLLHCGEARVLTEAQAGPLYRVLGSSLSITCNVSGFVNVLTQQQFEFRVIKPERPTFDINIISTDEPDFGYAKYVRRVQNGEITLKHLSTNSVRFEIQTLEKSDEGEYECFVKNPESSYDGTYNAKTIVKVIDNSLSVSSSEATPLSYNEGDALTLACQASSNTIQHTHLSLAWFLHRDGVENAQPIISLDRDFTLSPGMGFEGRYQAGLIKLDKIGEATYRLKMAQLEVSDQGRLYCQAQEWIQDPDRSWYSIAKKDSEETMLEVKARDTSSLFVRITPQHTPLQEGQPLSLSCSIDTLDLEKRFFSVAWLQGGVELARMGPTGVLSVGPKYSDRAQQGELRAARTGDKDYHLILQPVRTEDQGDYFCRAWPQNRDQEGAFTPGAPQNSSLQFVTIDTILTLYHDGKISWSGDQQGYQTKVQTSEKEIYHHLLINGASQREGPSFELTIQQAQISDTGLYTCEVAEWLQDPRGEWYELSPVSKGTQELLRAPAVSYRQLEGLSKMDAIFCIILLSATTTTDSRWHTPAQSET
uniref:Zgc:91849 n=1 Tax=Echeneis naucrates TaxID=173247 RepID=A0A665TZN3_ECHNA